jgi:hypothetical protein
LAKEPSFHAFFFERHRNQTNHTNMQRKHAFSSLIKTLACGLLVIGAAAHAADTKADPTGTWTWTQAGRDGGPERTNTLTFKMEDSKLAGKLSAPGRGGAANTETAVSDLKVEGDAISFAVVRQFNENSITNKYAGKISGDKIVGKIEFVRQGEAQSRDWEATRAKK